MSATGTWTTTISSPLGALDVVFELKEEGGALTGTTSGFEQTAAISEGRVDGSKLSWKAEMSKPMPMTLVFSGELSGDVISGEVQAGMMGSFPFTANRSA